MRINFESEMSLPGIEGNLLNFNELDRSEIWFQVIDVDGRVLYMNEYAERLCGYSLIEIRKHNNFWENLFRTPETGLRILNLYRNMIRRERDSRSNTTKIISKSGEEIQLIWNMKCNRNQENKVTSASIIGIARSRNLPPAPKKAVSREHRYRQIFRNAPIGFFRSLPEGRFIEVNDALAKLLGYDTPEDVLKNISDIGPAIYQDPDFRTELVSNMLQAGTVKSFETVFVNKKREPIDVRINVSSRYDEDLGNHILEGTIENISERKATERKLQRNLAKYSTLFEKSPISIWEIDYSAVKKEISRLNLSPDRLRKFLQEHPERLNQIRQKIKVIDVNQATLDLFGVANKEELIRKHMDFTGRHHSESELESVEAFLENKTSFEYETVLKTTHAGDKYINVRWVAAPDLDEPYSKVLVTMVDITEQRAEHEALRKSRNQLSSLISSMDDFVFILNKEGRYEYIAPTRPEFLISSTQNIEGKFVRDFVPPDLNSAFIRNIHKSLAEKNTVSFEYPIQIRGKECWFEAKVSPLSSDNVIVVARDITNRVVTDKVNQVMLNVARAVSTTDEIDDLFDIIRDEISAIIDTRNFFLALFDKKTNTLSLPYFKDEKDSFDHFPAEKTLSALVIREKRSMLLKKKDFMKLAEEGEISLVGSLARVWLGIPLVVEGEVLGLMVVQNYENEAAIREEHRQLLEMISPQVSLSIMRKQSEQLLKLSEKQLRESNRTKDRFFNIIAHDLKNPFNAIIGFTTLLVDEWSDFDDDDKISMISSIKSSSEGAFDLLMNLLEWSRLHVGKIVFEPEFIDYASLIRLNFSLLKMAAEKKNIKMISTGLCDKMVWADPNMIKTVIRNLLTNAIKFTPSNGTVTVECFKDQNHPGMIVLSIKDNGVGIPQDQVDNLFNLTSSESKNGTEGETGTGLGLVLCREFIEKNKGKIWAESETGVGSTFYIALPVRPGKF